MKLLFGVFVLVECLLFLFSIIGINKYWGAICLLWFAIIFGLAVFVFGIVSGINIIASEL